MFLCFWCFEGLQRHFSLPIGAHPRQSSGRGNIFRVNRNLRVLTFENYCLQGELTFGDPFQGSGVDRPANRAHELFLDIMYVAEGSDAASPGL